VAGVGPVEISPVGSDEPVARALIAAALADLAERYGGSGDDTPVDAGQFAPSAGAFLVAFVDGVPVGCCAWRTRADDPDAAELKRLYTAPGWRGRGVASALVRAVEGSARAAGRKRIILETGRRQPEAVALYAKLGYDPIPNFGHYRDYEGCLSFGRVL
jgi:GNAT superfamily N-acetyltransferase